MTNERHEKALEAAMVASFGEGSAALSNVTEEQRKILLWATAKAITAYLQDMDAVIVPKNPSEEMLDSVRHLITWAHFDRPTERHLKALCERRGVEPPEGCRDVDHVPPKALIASWNYQHMLSKAPNHFTNGE